MASLLEPQSATLTSLSEPSDAAPWRPKSVHIGMVLANRYRIVSQLGLGSTGAVFQADDLQQGKSVAVRVLVPQLAQEPGLIARIRARIERNAAIDRRDANALINFVDITDIGMTLETEVFVVTDYMDGDHVATMLTRGGRLPWSRARSLIIRLAQIVHGLHQEGIILGALEARRCYAIRGKNKHETIKVLSTAIVEHLAARIGPHASHAAAVLARYVAPEQACGEPIDARSDVYSLGVIAYELLTGQLPFTDPNPVRLIAMHLQRPPTPPREAAPGAGIPLDVEAALLRALAKAPEDRFPSMDAFGSALLAIPEAVMNTGAHAIVPASLAASEIPAQRVEAPGAAAATLAVTNRTSPPAEPPGLGDPGVAEATLAVTNETSPPAEPLAEVVARTEARAEAALHDPRPTPDTEAVPVARPAPVSARIQTHVTLRPGSLTSDAITTPSAANMQQSSARPATLPPTLGSPLRLPPPPRLGAPAPGSNVPIAIPRPPTLGMATLPRPSSGPFAAAPAQAATTTPEATATADAARTSETPPETRTAETSSETRPADTLVEAPPAETAAVASSATPASDSPPATPPTSLESPVVAPPAVAAVLEAARTDEQRAASSTSSGRRPVIRLTDVRKSESDSASSSGTYVRSALTDGEATRPRSDAPAAAFAAAAAAAASAATSASKSDSRRVAVSDEAVRSAALKPQLAPVPASLSQVAGTTESLVAQVPQRRTGLWIGVGMVAAAGIAALVMTSPSFTGKVAPSEPVAARPAAPKVANANPPSTPPDRATGVVAPRPDPDPTPDPADSLGEPEPTADTSKDPGATAPIATLVPADPETKTEDGKKKDPTKKKKRVREETPEEEPEKDVFDQLREHMAKKKAAEDAYKASLQKPATPTPPATSPTPDTKATEPLSEADKAKETLERARQAASSGNPQLAYSLAKQSYQVTKSQEALELMGVSACRLKNAENARSAANSLSGARRDAVVAACSKTGTEI